MATVKETGAGKVSTSVLELLVVKLPSVFFTKAGDTKLGESTPVFSVSELETCAPVSGIFGL